MRLKEVSMRPPSVFVRPLAPPEGQRLKRLSRQAKHASTRQRAAILLASATAMSAREIAELWLTDESHVRKVIHDFNAHGFDSLRPRFRGGRPRRISTDDEQRIVAVAGARPDTLGVPLTRWSLAKLSEHPSREGIAVSAAHLAGVGRGGSLLPTHTLLESEPRPRLRGQGGTGARALSQPARRRGGDQLRRDGAGQPLSPPRPRLGPTPPARAAPRHLHTAPWRP